MICGEVLKVDVASFGFLAQIWGLANSRCFRFQGQIFFRLPLASGHSMHPRFGVIAHAYGGCLLHTGLGH